jgi:hypothetical protein
MTDDALLLATVTLSDIIANKSRDLNMCEKDCLVKAFTIIIGMKAKQDKKKMREEDRARLGFV